MDIISIHQPDYLSVFKEFADLRIGEQNENYE